MKSLLLPALVSIGKRGFLASIIALVLACGVLIEVASAEIASSVGTGLDVSTLATQAHPKKIKLALMVMDSRSIEGAGLEYRLDRWNFGPVLLRNGGQMIATLKLITEGGAQIVGEKQKTKCEAASFEDERGFFNQRECFLYWEGSKLHIDLKPGDVLLWTIKFRGMPKLEFEPDWEGSVYRDRFELQATVG